MELVKSINCRGAVALIGDYLEGKLSWRDRRRLEKHLSGCDACGAYLEQMRATIALPGRVGPEDLSDDALDTLMDVVDQFQRDRDTDDSS